MSSLSFRSSKPDRWIEPRPHMDATLRRKIYGPIQPLHPPTWLERLFGMR